jgi:hypothetical protein
LRINSRPADEGFEPAVDRGDNPFATDDIGIATDALRHELGVFDIVGKAVDDAGQNDRVVWEGYTAPYLPFMLMSGVGSLKRKGSNICLKYGFENFLEWDVVNVRTLVVAPAQMKTESLLGYAAQRFI